MKVYYCEELDDLMLASYMPDGSLFGASDFWSKIPVTETTKTFAFKEFIVLVKENNPMVQYRYEYIGEF